tara:strand:- start:282 stop:551 length:270 start_codon:yes stop_codon:yes gene_type:complete
MSKGNRFYSDKPIQARVIYSQNPQPHYASGLHGDYKEVKIKAVEITSEFLQELYLDKSMTAFKFILQIQKRYNDFDKMKSFLYFYYLYN